MMRSMFSAITGLKNHQTMMDVIGNNIANVNTVGFKKSRVTFQDALYQTIKGASSAQGNRGGTNPMQVGLGMTIAAIDTIHTPSSLEATGNMTDLAIEGDGFFVLSDGQNYYYTRAGNFGFDEQGNLVNTANGLKVLGWQNTQSKTPQNISPIQIQKGIMMPAKATSYVRFAKNLNAADPDGTQYDIPFKVYDSLGKVHNFTITFVKDSTVDLINGNGWRYSISYGGSTIHSGTLVFDNNGNLSGSGNISIVLPNLSFDIDFSSITQFAKETTVDLSYQDGYPAGTLLGISIDSKGVITGVFDNGQIMELAQVALAVFDNPAGLIKAGGNTYMASNNSGQVQIGIAGTGGRGTISPGALEMSNVDLAEEFTRMIITQRGFQANSRIITVSDEMLQELVNIKR
ncbi:MAG: flagellar hook protein FlgE [Thermosediminibacteraceae bacterium]|nr:flagellar hook protein FlgE [Thermosediminibacteraceae bacterium]